MSKITTIQLLLTEDEAQELSILLGREMRRGKLEADLVDLREELNKKRVEAGWLSAPHCPDCAGDGYDCPKCRGTGRL